MYSEILHHIERLQVELASVNSHGGAATVTNAVALIAAQLRADPPAGPITTCRVAAIHATS